MTTIRTYVRIAVLVSICVFAIGGVAPNTSFAMPAGDVLAIEHTLGGGNEGALNGIDATLNTTGNPTVGNTSTNQGTVGSNNSSNTGTGTTSENQTLRDVLLTVFNLLNFIIPILIILGVVLFIVSVLRYVFSSSEDDKAKARQNMIWGIVALFVIVSVWGLVNLLANTFDLNNDMPDIPCIEDPNTGECI